MVLIDAAKGSATKPLDLSKHPADFVVISFYKVCVLVQTSSVRNYYIEVLIFCLHIVFVKLFGYPTGLGALIARNGKHLMLKD